MDIKIAAPTGVPIWVATLIRNTVNAIRGALVLDAFEVADVPDPAMNLNRQIIVTDESAGRVTAVSDGTDWRRTGDGVIIS